MTKQPSASENDLCCLRALAREGSLTSSRLKARRQKASNWHTITRFS